VLLEELAGSVKSRLEGLSGGEVFLDYGGHGDFSTAMPLKVAKESGRDPAKVAGEWAGKIEVKGVRAEAAAGFINFFLTDEALLHNLERILEFPPAGKTAVVDYSSPNIAKPFSVGHLRSTVIGESVRRTLGLLGWEVHGINFLGDWGTQFGKLMAACEEWPVELGKEPIKKLLDLYVRFHKEAGKRPELEEKAREWFQRLEEGDKEAVALWKKFRKLSLKEFNRIYDILGTSELIDAGESRFVGRSKELVDELLEKGVAERDQGAVVVPTGAKVPLMLRKSDGTTIYSSRDLAAALWRYEEFRPDAMLYVVGNEQKFHFRQLFAVLRRLDVKAELEHVSFGMVSLPEGKMSTRRGRVVFLEDVLDEAVGRVEKIMAGRGGSKEDARRVGVGAVKFADLKNNRTRDVKFTWDLLSFEGDTGPYVQYTAVRAMRIGEKFGTGGPGLDGAFTELARILVRFRHAVLESARTKRPDVLANYLLAVCKVFNELYVREQMGGEPAREWLAERTHAVLEKGLWLLGIEVPEKM
jgi:arginyl-tRNA synthetase